MNPIGELTYDPRFETLSTADGEIVCIVYATEDGVERTHALYIARACNAHEGLLAALDGLLATEDSESGDCQWCTEEVDGDECTNPECPGVKARAAIAKATRPQAP